MSAYDKNEIEGRGWTDQSKVDSQWGHTEKPP
jgi:hypothetical protein